MAAGGCADKECPSKPVWVSPTPSSICPTESTAPGVADLHDCDSASEASAIPEECEEDLTAEEALAPAAAEARNWRQISERLRRVFVSADSDEEDDNFDFDFTGANHAFSMQEEDAASVAACRLPSKMSSSPPAGAFSSVFGQVGEDASQSAPFHRVADEADNASADAPFSDDVAVGSSNGNNWQRIGWRLGQILRTADPEESTEENEAEAEPEPCCFRQQ